MQSELLHHPHHTQVHAHIKNRLLRWCFHLNCQRTENKKAMWMLWTTTVQSEFGEKRLRVQPRFLKLSADVREDVVSVLPTNFIV